MKDIESHEEKIRLVFPRDDQWQEIVVPRVFIASKSKIVQLADHGVPVTSETARGLVEFLSHFETANLRAIPCSRCSSRMGWLGDQGPESFLWGREWISEGRLDDGEGRLSQSRADASGDGVIFAGSDEGDDQLALGMRSQGLMEAWKKAALAASGFPHVMAALYASFAAPVLEILNAPNFVVDLAGETSRGKTITQRLAASVWGCPDLQAPGSMLKGWDNTPTWIERAAATRSGLPLILDDSTKAGCRSFVRQVVYNVSGGQGRGRGSFRGMQRTRTYHTILISSGEAPITSYVNEAGGHARVLLLWGSPFGDGNRASLVNDLNEVISRHYGLAGPAFITFLLRKRDRWGNFQQAYQDLRSSYTARAEGNPVMGRLAAFLAVVEVAAGLAHEALDLAWDSSKPIEALWQMLAEGDEETNQPEKALRDLYSWALSHADCFVGRAKNGSRCPGRGWAGLWRKDDGKGKWPHIAFHPPQLRAVLKELQYRPDAMIRSWADRGWLDVDGDRNGRRHKTLRVEAETSKFIAIRRAVIDGWSEQSDAEADGAG